MGTAAAVSTSAQRGPAHRVQARPARSAIPVQRPLPWVCALLVGLAMGMGPGPAAAATPPVAGRVAPPADTACPPDRLTLYAGRVLRYERSRGQTALRIATDWDTVETVVLRHPDGDDASPWFLLKRQAFTATDWSLIEERPGQLRAGVRAAAWVCDDGRNPTVDWTPAPTR